MLAIFPYCMCQNIGAFIIALNNVVVVGTLGGGSMKFSSPTPDFSQF